MRAPTSPPLYCAHTRHTVNSAGRWNVTHGFDSRGKAHILPDNAHSNGQYFSGAMVESSRNVQKANTLPHKTAHTKHTLSSAGQWRKCLGRFKMQALTPCDAEVVSTRTQQSVSSRASSKGRWMKVQMKFKVQAHNRSGVVMDIAAFKVSHSVGCDIDATALRIARAGQAS